MITTGILIILLLLIICALFIPGQRGVCKTLAMIAFIVWIALAFKLVAKF